MIVTDIVVTSTKQLSLFKMRSNHIHLFKNGVHFIIRFYIHN